MTLGRRAALVAAFAVVAALGPGGAIGPAPARAAATDLTLVAATTYTVDPAATRVRISSVITATNHLTNTVTKQFFFRTAYLSVLPGTSGFKITSPGLKPIVHVSARRSTFTLLKIDFGKDLPSGKSLVLTLTFDLKDPGGAPDRPVRISPSIVSFTAWAFASTGATGSSVTVRFPAGYHVTVGRGPIAGPTTDAGTGAQLWATGSLPTPLSFIADFTADRPGDFDDTSVTAAVGAATAAIDLRSWPDDTAWRDRVSDLLVRGLPALGDEIGLAWPVEGELAVQEALVRNTGGYAGLFDPAARQILVSYTASPSVVLHEVAHAWFNGTLVADRWAAEAFASYYASRAATALKLKLADPVLTDALKASALPLNAWGPLGSASADAEAYGYAASFSLAQAVAARAGEAGLQAVWSRAAARTGAYQPAAGSETVEGPPDWRGLLDLLEDATGQRFDDLWRTWVARPDDLALLDARAEARAAYAKAVTDAGAWSLPRQIREELRAWQFDAATRDIAAAEAIIAQRADLEAAARSIGVTVPRTVQTAFEGGASLAAAATEANAELVTLEAIRQAAATDPAANPSAPDTLVAVGLIGVDPAAELAAARAAFEASDLESAIRDASTAADHWTQAADRGRARLVSLGLLALALLLVWRTIVLYRRRPRQGWTAD